jgi:penicillin-binding protein 1B
MALLLEFRFSKHDILEAYLNDVYLGQDGARAIHGLAAGSQFYFGVDLDRLEIAQVALLIGTIKGPSYFDPRRYPERALKRRNLMLNAFVEVGLIKPELAKLAAAQPLGVLKRPPRKGNRYPAFMELVRAQLNLSYRREDLEARGLSIFTTLDPVAQTAAQEAVGSALSTIEKGDAKRQLQGAFVLTDVDSGDILALIGDRQPSQVGFNRALRAERPIGSIVKPLIYLLAFSDPSRYNLASQLEDAPIALKQPNGSTWRPSNYDNQTHGRVSTLIALTRSYNLATVRLGLELGVDNVIGLMKGLGLRRHPPPNPSLLLGALALTPLEVAQLYQVIAARGQPMPLRAVTTVVARDGRVLQRAPDALSARDRPAPNYLLTLAMQEAMQTGTGKGLDPTLKSTLTPAGKTGTSNDQRDSWFVGFTGSHLGVAWVGRDDNKPSGVSGASGAMQLWAQAFKRIPSEPLKPAQPESVEFAWLDANSGLLTTPECGNAVYLPFVRGYTPIDFSACATVQPQDAAPVIDLLPPEESAMPETSPPDQSEPPKKRRRWRWFWEKD